MNIHLFYHSIASDWNNGNAHFLRGVASELIARGHSVRVHEPADGWSRRNLLAEHGPDPLRRFSAAYPGLASDAYDLSSLDEEAVLSDADLVIVHEWNDPVLVRRLGSLRRRRGFILLYHDTHHRLVSDANESRGELLRGYDGVLAYGAVLRDLYLREGVTGQAWTWHEAADITTFMPYPRSEDLGDVVWIGNWGDDERTEELREYLIEPIRSLGLKARMYGVRYPQSAREELASAGIEYAGWLPNFEVPRIFARFKVTVHVPRRPYVRLLPGIPTIRPFEAMACGIPLITAPWVDSEGLFQAGRDYLVARDGAEMRLHLSRLLERAELRQQLAEHARATIQTRHTCAHRVDELLAICDGIRRRQRHAAPAISTAAPEAAMAQRAPSF